MCKTKKSRTTFIKIFSLTIFVLSVYSLAVAIHTFLKSQNIDSLFSTIGNVTAFLTAASLVYFIFSQKTDTKFLIVPCVLIIASILVTWAGVFTKGIDSIRFYILVVYYLFGIISHSFVAIDIMNGFRRLKFDIRILIAYSVSGFLYAFGFDFGFGFLIIKAILAILLIIPLSLNPNFLLILILWFYQKDLKD